MSFLRNFSSKLIRLHLNQMISLSKSLNIWMRRMINFKNREKYMLIEYQMVMGLKVEKKKESVRNYSHCSKSLTSKIYFWLSRFKDLRLLRQFQVILGQSSFELCWKELERSWQLFILKFLKDRRRKNTSLKCFQKTFIEF